MLTTEARNDDPHQDDDGGLHRIQHAIEHATHLLPCQGPIKVFVHHNTLHAFEDMSFEQGVLMGLRTYGCEPYLSEARYREEFAKGRIEVADLQVVLDEDLPSSNTLVTPLATRRQLRLEMLRCRIERLPSVELRWMLAETDVLQKFRPETSAEARETILTGTKQRAYARQRSGEKPSKDLDSKRGQASEVLVSVVSANLTDAAWESIALKQLWHASRSGVERLNCEERSVGFPKAARCRDLLLEAAKEDTDLLVHEVLIRFCSVFLDQGFSGWELPLRDAGFWESFSRLYSGRWAPTAEWMNGLSVELDNIRRMELTPLEVVARELERLGIPHENWESIITKSLLALRGWAGMIWQMETNVPWTPRPAEPGTLNAFLAARLLLDRLAAEYIARRRLGISDIRELPTAAVKAIRLRMESPNDSDAFVVFQVAQFMGWSTEQLETLTNEDWIRLVSELRQFNSLERRRVFHLAYEARYRRAALDAVAVHSACRRQLATEARRSKHNTQAEPASEVKDQDEQIESFVVEERDRSVPRFQFVTCIDDREESFRRYLEEVEPECETFGAAGFFAVVIYYRGAAEAHYRPLCPVNAIPKHYVREEPIFSAADEDAIRSQRRRLLGQLSHQIHTNSRTLLGGLVTGVLGSLATFPLVARVLAPHAAARVRNALGSMIRPPLTELHLEREASQPGPDYDALGFSIPEMAGIVIRILQDIGLVRHFSKIIVFFGHGSSSFNNPHESAYNCGACSGGRGGPNARSFALMANDPRVRRAVAEAGVIIPEETHFVGGYHNTCSDRVEYYDLDQLPRSHRKLFRELENKVDQARALNALERTRRFETTAFGRTPQEALQHVEARSEDLSQARPEYNHATNALCFVGQREWSRGLFLDRRAFLASYDPSIDDEQGTIVERILQAAIPVCGGISLEYYFSTVDPEGYGCGSKLPHNVVGLAGVMTGAASDLRPGLSAQMVEIHEPMRILFVVQTTVATMQRIIRKNPAIQKLVEGAWVQLACFDAQTSLIELYRDGRFVPYNPGQCALPEARQSVEWFEGQRDHLGFASIQSDAAHQKDSPRGR